MKYIIIFLGIIFVARGYLGFTRYLDVDEFAHLHWTYLIAHGSLPYKDFFLYHIPFFQWLLAPLFLLPPSWNLVIASRMFIWILFGLNLFLLYRITFIVTGKKEVGLLALFTMAVFPMTFDKSIEVRPDFLMTFFFLASVLLIITRRHTGHKFFVVGLLYSLAILTFPKILFTLPSVFFLLIVDLWQRTKKITRIIPFFTGITLPIGLFVLYLLSEWILPNAIQAIFHDSVAVSAGKEPFSLWLALSPYPLVYVNNGGISWPWIVNTGIWITGLLGLIILLRKNRNYGIFFLLFFGCAILFLYLFPAPYLQYFLPLSICASLLAAIFLNRIFVIVSKQFNNKKVGQFAYVIIILLLLSSFWQQYKLRIAPGADNNEQKKVVEDILKISKPDDTVYDMVGSYIFRPDGYFICCHPYTEFVDRLSLKVPTLRDSLLAHQTKFLVLDRTGQSLWLPKKEDLDFLHANYVPSRYPKIYVLKTEYDLIK